MTATALAVTGLRKEYDKTAALVGVDLCVAAGTSLALLGKNGAGKTTLMSIVAGLRRPTSGSVDVFGQGSVAKSPRLRRLIGYAPQELAICPFVSVRENILLFTELVGVPRHRRTSEITRVVELLALDGVVDRLASRLSGGEKRRLHTAMSLVGEPRLLLLDEPTVGADVETRQHVLTAIRSLVEEGAALVYTTHYLGEVRQLKSAEIAILHKGALIAQGSWEQIVSSHSQQGFAIAFAGGEVPETLRSLGHVIDSELRLSSGALGGRSIFDLLVGYESTIQSVRTISDDLETAFLSATADAAP